MNDNDNENQIKKFMQTFIDKKLITTTEIKEQQNKNTSLTSEKDKPSKLNPDNIQTQNISNYQNHLRSMVYRNNIIMNPMMRYNNIIQDIFNCFHISDMILKKKNVNNKKCLSLKKLYWLLLVKHNISFFELRQIIVNTNHLFGKVKVKKRTYVYVF